MWIRPGCPCFLSSLQSDTLYFTFYNDKTFYKSHENKNSERKSSPLKYPNCVKATCCAGCKKRIPKQRFAQCAFSQWLFSVETRFWTRFRRVDLLEFSSLNYYFSCICMVVNDSGAMFWIFNKTLYCCWLPLVEEPSVPVWRWRKLDLLSIKTKCVFYNCGRF